MSVNREQELQRAISDLTARLDRRGIQILEHNRPWPNRMATWFEIGRPGCSSEIVLTDEFLRDLPATKEYQASIDAYAAAFQARLNCGSPNLFYCKSELAVDIAVIWPIQPGIGGVTSWFLTKAMNHINATVALCCVERRPRGLGGTIFDDLRVCVSRIRRAIDDGAVSFYEPNAHPESYQPIRDNIGLNSPSVSQYEMERFLAGKVYFLGFRSVDVPREVPVLDEWDADYLNVPRMQLSQAAQVLKARGLIKLEASQTVATAGDKLLTAGWPAALESITRLPERQNNNVSLQTLPKKEALLSELRALIEQKSDVAVLVIDLDKFKEVNDTKGHIEGDACLERVVKALATVLGRKGFLHRWGGDEFAILLPDFCSEEARATGERARKAIEESRAGGDILVTASIGVCGRDQALVASAEALLDLADKAMYASKRSGKNRVTVALHESAIKQRSSA